MKTYWIKSSTPSRRRAGFGFSLHETPVAADQITAEQLDAIHADPMLSVRVVDETEAKTTTTTAKPKPPKDEPSAGTDDAGVDDVIATQATAAKPVKAAPAKAAAKKTAKRSS